MGAEMNVLNGYLFPDGLKIYFMDDKRNHLKVLPGETISFHLKIDKEKFKFMKISYDTWIKRYCKTKEVNVK